MEFFYAKIYWSGYGEIITNVAELPNPDTDKLTDLGGDYAILCVSLKDFEIAKLRDYLRNEFGKTIDKNQFENYMGIAFYNGSPIDSYFNLEKFLRTCKELQIKPIMFFHRYIHILTLNMA